MTTATTAIHLACGGGGTTLGFEQAGIHTALAFDVDPVVIETHQVNFPGVPVEVLDIRAVQAADLPAADVWTCGIPCAPYSIAGRRLAEADPRDISFEVARLLREAREGGAAPRYIFLENVPLFGKSAGAAAIRGALDGYAIFEAVLFHANFGVSQARRRWHIVAGVTPPPPVPEPTHAEHPTLFGQQPWVRFGAIRDGAGVGPVSARALRGLFRRAIHNAAKYGNAFRPAIVTDEDLLPTVLASWSKGFGRSQVVLVYEGGRLRRVSLLEARRAQGFADDYVFAGTVAQRWGQIGRAVAPPVARAVAEAILEREQGRG